MTVQLGPTRLSHFDHTYPADLVGKVQYVHGAPLGSYVSSHFGPRIPFQTPTGTTSDFHTGIDLVADFGTPIVAPAPGDVIFSGLDTVGNRLVALRFDDGSGALFLHIDGWQAPLGVRLARGEVLGHVGSTGMSTGPHLHYMRVRSAQPGAFWYPTEQLIDPFSPEGGHVEALTQQDGLEVVRDVTVGSWPVPGTVGTLVCTAVECTPVEVVAEAESAGVPLRSLWTYQAGIWSGYLVGAPPAINARFPSLLAVNTVLYVLA